MSPVKYEGWMKCCGRRKFGCPYIDSGYFVLGSWDLAYYKWKPQDDMAPIQFLIIDGNCRTDFRGPKNYKGHMLYVLRVYNIMDKHNRIKMAEFTIEEVLIWKGKIESVINQRRHLNTTNGIMIQASFLAGAGINADRNASSSDRESMASAEDGEENDRPLIPRTIDNALDWPQEGDSVLSEQSTYDQDFVSALDSLDWTEEGDSVLSEQSTHDQVFSGKQWRLVRCQNGLRIFEEHLEAGYPSRSCSRAMKAVGVVKASCEAIFKLVMRIDETRLEWDCSFQDGRVVAEVDGHTTILYHRLQLGWFSMLVWSRDLCYERKWRRNDDGSYVVLFRSTEHPNCGPQSGFVRAHIESGGFKISPLKSGNGRTRTQVQHLMQIDLKGWGINYFPAFRQLCLLQMLNSVAGLREWFSQTDETYTVPSMASGSVSAIGHHLLLDEELDEDEDDQIPELEEEAENTMKQADEDPLDQLDLSFLFGNLQRDDHNDSRNCWKIPDGNNFKVRSKSFCYDKTKIRAGKPLMELVAVDWFKDVKRMDHVARRQGCAVQIASEKGLFTLVINVQVPASSHYSIIFYFVSKTLVPGSLLQQFVDGDNEFRNSRFKLIPSVHKGSWIVRQSVGSSSCLLGKRVVCTYIRGPKYLEIDIDIGSSTVAGRLLKIVFGAITTLEVDMAFLIQANTYEELPERLIGAVRVSHLELSSAIVPLLEPNTSTE